MTRNDDPEPEVAPRAKRRTFTARYKSAVLAEYDQLPPGERVGLLRREGLHSSHITQWRKARDRGAGCAGWPVGHTGPSAGGST